MGCAGLRWPLISGDFVSRG